MDPQLTDLTLSQAAAHIRARTVSPVELAEAYLERIDGLNPVINAYITVTAERAREDARRAADELAAGTHRGPLHGVPIALKDIYATAGIRTTAGSKILADWVPDTDSTVARKLDEAGSILLGKTNTHEFAYGGTTINPHYGPAHNPWNLDCIAGGSSGGSSAAIAARLAVGTMGTDTAGSIRLPAALCGVVGLKPTYGRVSKAGVVPLSWSFDHTGPITRTVEDAALLLQVVAGYDAADSSTVPVPVPDYTAELRAGLRGLRVGVPRDYFFENVSADVASAVESAIALLGESGAEVCPVDLHHVAEAMTGRTLLSAAEARVYHAESLRMRPEDFGADVLTRLSRELPDAQGLAEGLNSCRALAEEMRTILQRVDVLVTPTVPILAPRIQDVNPNGTEMSSLLLQCTAPFNATWLPALSVPCGFSTDGLPVGLQIAGRPFDESTVLRVGYAYEAATDWHQRRPAGLTHQWSNKGEPAAGSSRT